MPVEYGIANNAPPSTVANGTAAAVRSSRYGEQYTLTAMDAANLLAADGFSFRASNATPGTAIAMGIQTTFSATANVLAVIENFDSGGGKSLFLDYARLICVVAGATTSAADLAIRIDTTLRRTTGGSGGTLLTTVNANSGSSNASIGRVYFGAVTAAAESAAKQVARAKLKTQIAPCWTIGDELLLNFAANGEGGAGLISGAGPITLVKRIAPVVIAPGHSALLHMWNTANAATAPSWECDFAWTERHV